MKITRAEDNLHGGEKWRGKKKEGFIRWVVGIGYGLWSVWQTKRKIGRDSRES